MIGQNTSHRREKADNIYTLKIPRALLVVVFYCEFFLRTSKKGALMLTLFPSPKAVDYDKFINFLNKRKNIKLNQLKQRGNEDVKNIEYSINNKGELELLEIFYDESSYNERLYKLEFDEKYPNNNTIPCTIQELVVNNILDLSKYMYLTHEYMNDGFDIKIVLHGIFTTLEEAGDQELEDIVAVIPGEYINHTAYEETIDDDLWCNDEDDIWNN